VSGASDTRGGPGAVVGTGASHTLGRLRSLLAAEGGLIADLLVDEPPDAHAGGPARAALAGPRVDGSAPEYELLIEAIYEGYLLHYHRPRVVRPPEQDLGLLAGDRLYALGLARLVALGDVVAVAELADVIALSALAHGAGNAQLAEAVWAAGARAVGWGPSASHERAKALAREGSPEALPSLQAVAAGDGQP
jgi:hypothetical protein